MILIFLKPFLQAARMSPVKRVWTRFNWRKLMTIKKMVFAGVALAALTGVAQANPMVGGAPIYQSKNIVENAVNSKDHTTLVAAVKAAGLVDTLSSPGPFTVFAPTNAAFKKLPPGTVEGLLKPEELAQLKGVLTYHVVAGTLTARDLSRMVREGGGKATLTTVEGEPLTVEERGGHIEVIDTKGDVATVTIPNVMQSNGVIHVVNTVLLP
jgi:uncharacterized surface protein with fasciclin (FAS1) repeats